MNAVWVPFAMIIVGVILRTAVPFFLKRLQAGQAGLPMPGFEKKYLVPPLCTIGLNLFAVAAQALADAAWVDRVVVMDARAALMMAIGEQEVLRWFQKAIFERKVLQASLPSTPIGRPH